MLEKPMKHCSKSETTGWFGDERWENAGVNDWDSYETY